MMSAHRYPKQPIRAQKSYALYVFALAVLGLGLLAWWRMGSAPSPAHYAILFDRSGSKIKNCGDVAALAASYIANAPQANGSTITLMATGDQSRGFEPMLLLEREIPFAHADPFRDDTALATGTGDLLSALTQACQEMTEADISPIRRGVERAVEHLAAKPGHPKELTVVGDLRENVDELSGDGVELIPNHQISVRFCGYSDLNSVRSANVAVLKAQWSSALFEEPSFQPYCGSPPQTLSDLTSGVGQ